MIRIMMLLVIFLQLGKSPSEPNLLVNAIEAYEAGNFIESLHNLKSSFQLFPSEQDKIMYNLAQVYIQLDSAQLAMSHFKEVLSSSDSSLVSLAYNQIGLLEIKEDRSEAALVAFKFALEYNPYSEDARHNFELLSLSLKQHEREADNQRDEDVRKKPNKNIANPSPFDYLRRNASGYLSHLYAYARWMLTLQKQLSSAEYTSSSEVTDTIPVEKAKVILEGMKDRKVQFIQQLKKKANSPKGTPSSSEW